MIWVSDVQDCGGTLWFCDGLRAVKKFQGRSKTRVAEADKGSLWITKNFVYYTYSRTQLYFI